MNRSLRLGLLGGLAGLLTWLVSEPFVRTATEHGVRMPGVAFTLGSFYGWFAHGMLGALIVGFISLFFLAERVSLSRAAAWGLAAFAIGGVLGWASDAASDILCIRMLQSSSRGFAGVTTIFWHFAVAMTLAMGIAVCTQPTQARLTRLALGGLVAAVMSYVVRMTLAPISAIFTIMRHGLSARVGTSEPWDLGRLGDHVTMGLVLGIAIGTIEMWMTYGSLRLVLGRNEGRDFPLGAGTSRVGSAEGIEVSLRGQTDVAPIHAYLDRQGSYFLLRDAGSGCGTFVNGQRIDQAVLSPGDTLTVGSCSLQFLTSTVAQAPYPIVPAYHQPSNPEPAPAHRLIDPFGKVIDLSPGSIVVGREATAGLCLSYDGSVSRNHARLHVEPQRVSVEDLGSRNGSTVNGNPVKMLTELRDGDQVQFGRSQFTYRRT